MTSCSSKPQSTLFRFLVCVYCVAFTVNCPAAKLVSYGTGDLAIDACRLTLGQDRIRMFWRGPDGSVFGSFGRLNAWLATRGETLVCATNAGIFGEDLRPIGMYVEGGRVLRKLNVRKQALKFLFAAERRLLVVGKRSGHRQYGRHCFRSRQPPFVRPIRYPIGSHLVTRRQHQSLAYSRLQQPGSTQCSMRGNEH
jgi:uncharacterized protein YigE (DUF2233 family)